MSLAELKSKYRKISSLDKAHSGWEDEYEVSSKQVENSYEVIFVWLYQLLFSMKFDYHFFISNWLITCARLFIFWWETCAWLDCERFIFFLSLKRMVSLNFIRYPHLWWRKSVVIVKGLHAWYVVIVMNCVHIFFNKVVWTSLHQMLKQWDSSYLSSFKITNFPF